MSRRGTDDASISVLETVTVGIMVFGVVLYVAGINEPTGDESGAHARVELFARDALAVLSGLPSEKGGYSTLLDELVADAKDGNESYLREQLDKYFPPGVAYNVYLNDGQESRPLLEDFEPSGPTVTVSRLVTAAEHRFFIFSSQNWAAGVSEVDTLDFYVVPLRNRYYDPHMPGELVFQNSYTVPWTLNETRGYLTVEAVPPELVDKPNGYATQYDKTSNETFLASVALAGTEYPERFKLQTTTDHPVSGHAYYEVEPSYTADSELMDTIVSEGRSYVEGSNRHQQRGHKVKMHYNYQASVDELTEVGWTVTEKKVRIYSPVDGKVIYEQPLANLNGQFAYGVPKDAPYGTYPVEWEFTLSYDSYTQIVRDVSMFHVTSGPAASAHPPVYRVELVAWLEGV